jgi:chromosome segregation ATPase
MTVSFQPESDESTSISYDQVVHELCKLGVAGLSPINNRNLGASWGSLNEKLNVLKTIEFLISRRKRILSDAARRSENRVDPLSSRTKNQQKTVNMLEQQKAELDQQIDEANQRLQACKRQRAEQKQTQTQELKEIEERIAAFPNQRNREILKK